MAFISAGRADDTDVVVVIPAHNEQQLIGDALAAVRRAADRVPERVGVVVVLDDCTDGTDRRAAPFGVRLHSVRAGNVGAARAAGMALAGPTTAWLACTDADSQVPGDWLVHQLSHARRGAALVLGTVLVEDWSGHPAGAGERFLAHYRPPGRAGGGHGHIHGANLGVDADWYRAVGGFRPLVAHEDVDLVRRLVAVGAPVVWDADNPVRTSARLDHRAPGGFGATLRRLEESA